MPTNYTQTGPYRYDYAIAGIPFLSAASEQYPYTRQTAQNRREQINTSRDVGEQSLDGWWYRSQSSFHMGAGLKYFDTISAESASMRFEDSAGVDVWTPGEVTHLRGTSRAYTAASGFALSFSSEGIASGEDGYIYADKTSDTLFWKNINGTTGSLAFTGENVLDVTDDGEKVYVLTSAGIYRVDDIDKVTRAKTKLYSRNFTRGRINFIKDRLMVVMNRNIYALGTNPTGSLPKTLDGIDGTDPETKARYQLPTGYRGWEFADGPNAIYLLAGSEESTLVYAFTISNDDTAELNDPVTVLEAPRGEQFLSMISYIGTYLIMGTTLGVRVGIIAGDSSVVMGPLTVKSDGPVRALFSMRDFVWAGGANVDGKYGLYRINLSTPLEADNLLFPYAKDIATDVAWSGSRQDYIQSITRFGKSDRLVFSLRRQNISDTGCGVYEEGTGRLTTGWLRTGRVRMDTTQPKIFYSLTLSAGGTAGTVATTHLDEADVSTALTTATFTGSLIQAKEIAAAPTTDASLWAQYKFTLNRTGGGVFRFSGYQLRVNPSQVKRRFIQVPLLCMAQEVGPSGRTISRSVFDRVEALEKAEEAGAPVVFQDFANDEERNVFIEEVQFISTHIPENYKQRSNSGGVLVVTLRATDETDSIFSVPASPLAASSELSFTADYVSTALNVVGAETMPRSSIGTLNSSVFNGEIRLSYLTPLRNVTASQVTMLTGGTAQAGASLVKMGVYSVDPVTGSLTLLAQTANDTSIFATTNTAFTRSFSTTGGYPSSILLEQGKRYAVGVIIVGASTTPVLAANAPGSAPFAISPRMNALFTGRTDLSASLSSGLSNIGAFYWARLS